MLTLSVMNESWLDLWSGKTKTYRIGICCLSAMHVVLRSVLEQRLVGSETG